MSLAREKTNSIRLYACIQTDCAQCEELVTLELLAGVNSSTCFLSIFRLCFHTCLLLLYKKKPMNSEHNHDDVII